MLCPGNAEAHLVTTVLGPIYDGIGHLALSPEVWVPVLAVALFAGLRGAAAGRLTLFLLPVAWLVGALVGCRTETVPLTAISAISFLVTGALVAADLHLKRGTVATIAVGSPQQVYFSLAGRFILGRRDSPTHRLIQSLYNSRINSYRVTGL
jgi:urease accessory protein